MSKRPRDRGKRSLRSGTRDITHKVKSAKGRRISSTNWLQRQLNDPYVLEAKKLGYRSRAAFKLIELDDKFRVLGPGKRIVDLGAAPGGWTQISVKRCGEKSNIVAIDINEMEGVTGAEFAQMDFLSDEAPERIKAMLDGPADVVLSDMAAPSCGHPATDHIRIMDLCESALMFAEEVLAPGGTFIAKALQGGADKELLLALRKSFKVVKHAKPKSSRQDSAEMYVIGLDFRGRQDDTTEADE